MNNHFFNSFITCFQILINFSVEEVQFNSVQFVSNSLQHHGLQHAMPPYTSPTPGVYPNSCPLSQWCHQTISSSVILRLLPSIPPSIRVFSNESALHIRWPKYWSSRFNISPSNEYPGLISSRIDWLDLLAVQGTLMKWWDRMSWYIVTLLI